MLMWHKAGNAAENHRTSCQWRSMSLPTEGALEILGGGHNWSHLQNEMRIYKATDKGKGVGSSPGVLSSHPFPLFTFPFFLFSLFVCIWRLSIGGHVPPWPPVASPLPQTCESQLSSHWFSLHFKHIKCILPGDVKVYATMDNQAKHNHQLKRRKGI